MNKDDGIYYTYYKWKRLGWYRKMGLRETLIFVCWDQDYRI